MKLRLSTKYIIVGGRLIRAEEGHILHVKVTQREDDPLLLKKGVPGWPHRADKNG